MRSLKNIMRWLTVLFLSLGMASCDVSENEADCTVDFNLTFSFTKNGQENFGMEIPSLSVFVYDRDKLFVGRWDEYDNSKFNADYTMTLPLTPGTYSFVVWGGLDDSYYLCESGLTQNQPVEPVVGETPLDNMTVRMKFETRNSYQSEQHFVDYIPTTQFHGSTEPIEIGKNAHEEITIDLKKNSKEISLTILGLPAPLTRANPYPNMFITMSGANGRYDFQNGFESTDNTLTYVQHDLGGNLATDTQRSTIHTLQMKYGNEYKLVLYNTDTNSEFYCTCLLNDCIGKIEVYETQEAVDAEDRFDIVLDLRSPLGVKVTVNGWEVEESGNIIQ